MKKLILIIVCTLCIQLTATAKDQTPKEKYGNFGPVLDMIASRITERNHAKKLNTDIKNTPKVIVVKLKK
jgi:hypothetical protein